MAKISSQKTEHAATPGSGDVFISPPNVVVPEVQVPQSSQLRENEVVVVPEVQVPQQQEQVVVEPAPDVPPALQQELQAPQPQPTEQQRVGFKRKTATQAIPVALSKSATLKDVENLLTEDLTDIYQAMTPQEQIAFRKKGEEVAHSIEALVVTFRATTKKVLDLIRSWLAMIPRVNRYFLEQESKIKTDEIMKLQKKFKEDAKKRVDVL